MKRETTMAFLAGMTVTGAFFAGMGMGSANGSAAAPLKYVGISEGNGSPKILREDGQIYVIYGGAQAAKKWGSPGPTK